MSQSDLKINKINSDIVWEMVWKAWELGKFNYPLALTLSFMFFGAMLLSMIPFIGPLLGGAIGALAPMLFYQASQAWEKGDKSDVSKVFSVFDNKDRLNALMPLIFTTFALAALPNILSYIPVITVITAPLPLITFPASVILGLAYPIMFFNYKDIGFKKGVNLAIEGVFKNIVPFIVGVFLLTVLSVLSMALLVIPFFLVVGPIIITYNYLWYRVVYEDLVLAVKDEGII